MADQIKQANVEMLRRLADELEQDAAAGVQRFTLAEEQRAVVEDWANATASQWAAARALLALVEEGSDKSAQAIQTVLYDLTERLDALSNTVAPENLTRIPVEPEAAP